MDDARRSPRLPMGRPPAIVAALGAGMLVAEDDTVTNWIEPRPALADPLGHLRLGVCTFVADGAGGLAGGLAGREGTWVVTTDLEVRLVAPVADATVRVVGRPLRAGTTTVVCDLDLLDEATGRPVGAGTITSHTLEVAEPMSRDQWPRGRRLRPDHDVDLTIPVIDLLEVRPAAEGAVEVPLTDGVRNPWGILHGGVVAVAAEEAVLRHPAATGRPPLGMLVRYLAPNRVGPIRFVPELIGADAAGAVFRVRSHDTGAADRATSVTVLTLGPELS